MAGQGFIPDEPEKKRSEPDGRHEESAEREHPMSARRDLTPRQRVHEPHRDLRRTPESNEP